MPKMTNATREIILANVLAATNFAEQIQAVYDKHVKLARAHVVGLLPEGFTEATKNLPREWFGTNIGVGSNSTIWKPAPAGIVSLKIGVALGLQYEPIRCPAYFNPAYPYQAYIDELRPILQRKYDLSEELEVFLKTCRTTDDIVAAMPELEKHIPDRPLKPQPVVVLTYALKHSLAQSGFDKTEK